MCFGAEGRLGLQRVTEALEKTMTMVCVHVCVCNLLWGFRLVNLTLLQLHVPQGKCVPFCFCVQTMCLTWCGIYNLLLLTCVLFQATCIPLKPCFCTSISGTACRCKLFVYNVSAYNTFTPGPVTNRHCLCRSLPPHPVWCTVNNMIFSGKAQCQQQNQRSIVHTWYMCGCYM